MCRGAVRGLPFGSLALSSSTPRLKSFSGLIVVWAENRASLRSIRAILAASPNRSLAFPDGPCLASGAVMPNDESQLALLAESKNGSHGTPMPGELVIHAPWYVVVAWTASTVAYVTYQLINLLPWHPASLLTGRCS